MCSLFIFAVRKEPPAYLVSTPSAGEGLALIPPRMCVCTHAGTVLVTVTRCGGGEVTAAVTHCVVVPQCWNIKT